jgi:hypothetical protein
MPAETIFIVRHAEKPVEDRRGTSNSGVEVDGEHCENSLSVVGWQRAGALAVLFGPRAAHHGLLTPGRLIAVAYGDENHKKRARHDTREHRPFQTVDPLSRVLDVPIECTWRKGDEAAVVASVLADRSRATLICWEHDRIPALARPIPVADRGVVPDQWPGNRYDLIWRFRRRSPDAALYDFHQMGQHVLAGDGD